MTGSKHIQLRSKVKSIGKKADFENILNESMLNETEKRMAYLYYVENKSIDIIAHELGYSSAGIVKMHKRILNKLESLL